MGCWLPLSCLELCGLLLDLCWLAWCDHLLLHNSKHSAINEWSFVATRWWVQFVCWTQPESLVCCAPKATENVDTPYWITCSHHCAAERCGQTTANIASLTEPLVTAIFMGMRCFKPIPGVECWTNGSQNAVCGRGQPPLCDSLSVAGNNHLISWSPCVMLTDQILSISISNFSNFYLP